jgi:proteasome lid subunit RPN8/RPN11
MPIELRQEHVERIHRHAAEAYPNECCGFLLGREENGRKVVLEVAPAKNVWLDSTLNPFEIRPEDSERNRNLVDPRDQLRIDREAREKGMDIISYYHSHPDHPARPSEFDRKNAWPIIVYVILAVEKGVPREMTAWLLSDDGARFLPEPLTVR